LALNLDDIAPPDTGQEVSWVNWKGETVTGTVRGLTNAQMVQIGRKYPDFLKTMFNEKAPPEARGTAVFEASALIVAHGIGKGADPRYEQAFERMDKVQVMRIATAILDLTNPREQPKPATQEQGTDEYGSPLPDPVPEADAAAAA
jgi:hypothetical protein